MESQRTARRFSVPSPEGKQKPALRRQGPEARASWFRAPWHRSITLSYLRQTRYCRSRVVLPVYTCTHGHARLTAVPQSHPALPVVPPLLVLPPLAGLAWSCVVIRCYPLYPLLPPSPSPPLLYLSLSLLMVGG